jgi:hypothetical protein
MMSQSVPSEVEDRNNLAVQSHIEPIKLLHQNYSHHFFSNCAQIACLIFRQSRIIASQALHLSEQPMKLDCNTRGGVVTLPKTGQYSTQATHQWCSYCYNLYVYTYQLVELPYIAV